MVGMYLRSRQQYIAPREDEDEFVPILPSLQLLLSGIAFSRKKQGTSHPERRPARELFVK